MNEQQKHIQIINAIAKLNTGMEDLFKQMKQITSKLQEIAGPCVCGSSTCDNREVCNQAKQALNNFINGVEQEVPLIGSSGAINNKSEK